MIGGLFKSASRLALVAVAGVMVGGVSAKAADLGGDCCADLEERVAELEATTARKGNRKVSLTISGWVNEGLLIWNDGREKNAYVGNSNYNRSRFRFTGDAKISPDWSAGFLLEIGVRSGSDLSTTARWQDDSLQGNAGLDVRHVAWWIENKQYGRVWVGQTANATAGLNGINLSQVADHSTVGLNNLGGGFQLRTKNNPSTTANSAGQFASAVTWAGLRGPSYENGSIGFGERYNVIKYVSPTIMGFIFSAAWGEDDMWDVALRYAGEFSGFKLAAGVGYMQWLDGNASPFNPRGASTSAGTEPGATMGAYGDYGCASAKTTPATALGAAINGDPANRDTKCESVQVGGSIMHVATGLYAAGSYARINDSAKSSLVKNVETPVDGSGTAWQIQAGIEQKWFSIGKTTVFGEYAQHHNGLNTSSGAVRVVTSGDALIGVSNGDNALITSSNTREWGFGVFQGIDAAAMTLYVQYKNMSADVSLANATTGHAMGKSDAIENFQLVMMGGIINF